jgi:hypothetical protein
MPVVAAQFGEMNAVQGCAGLDMRHVENGHPAPGLAQSLPEQRLLAIRRGQAPLIAGDVDLVPAVKFMPIRICPGGKVQPHRPDKKAHRILYLATRGTVQHAPEVGKVAVAGEGLHDVMIAGVESDDVNRGSRSHRRFFFRTASRSA